MMGDYSMVKLKTPKTYEDQLNHLINDKKLRVDNHTNALQILQRENYYRLSGYWINFIDKDDRFFNYITFEKIYTIYNFDKRLRGLLIELINDVEIYFKTRIANYHSLKYDGDGYLNQDVFNSKSRQQHDNLMDKIENLKVNNPNNLVIRHHKQKYKGIMPIWVVVELLSFGNISKLFSMMRNEDKNEYTRSSYIHLKYKHIESFYHALAYFRNQCCHFQRLYDVNHTIKMQVYRTPFYDTNIDNTTTFYFVYVLMLLNPNYDLGERVILQLVNEFKRTKVDESKWGFPYDWKKILRKANGYCIKK